MNGQNGSGTQQTHRRRAWATASLATFAAAALFVATTGGAQAAATPVGLGTADGFAVLAGAGISNTGATTITGDIGTFPTTTITGAGSMTVNGTNHAGDSVTQGAKPDLVTAYDSAAGQGPTSPIVADLGGTTLVSGVYNSATTLGLTGTLTLDAAGDSSAVFVFQAGSTLTTASGSRVLLINGAQACNVFWQIGSSATLGTGSSFIGTVMALTSITVTTGATVDGRVLARNGAVTLDTNTITRSLCSSSTAPYAANVGPGAQGLVCPWGGQFDGVGLCSGTGSSTLMNPSATPAPVASASATPAPAVVASTAPTTPIAVPLPPAAAQRPPAQPPTHDTPAQVPNKPSGGVPTGDDSTG